MGPCLACLHSGKWWVINSGKVCVTGQMKSLERRGRREYVSETLRGLWGGRRKHLSATETWPKCFLHLWLRWVLFGGVVSRHNSMWTQCSQIKLSCFLTFSLYSIFNNGYRKLNNQNWTWKGWDILTLGPSIFPFWESIKQFESLVFFLESSMTINRSSLCWNRTFEDIKMGFGKQWSTLFPIFLTERPTD